MSRPTQVFMVVSLLVILAMSAYQTYVIARTVKAFQTFGEDLEGTFEDFPTEVPDAEPVEGLEEGVGEQAGDQAACAHINGGARLDSQTATEAYQMAEIGGDIQMVLDEWLSAAFAAGPDPDPEEARNLNAAEIAVVEACAVYGG